MIPGIIFLKSTKNDFKKGMKNGLKKQKDKKMISKRAWKIIKTAIGHISPRTAVHLSLSPFLPWCWLRWSFWPLKKKIKTKPVPALMGWSCTFQIPATPAIRNIYYLIFVLFQPITEKCCHMFIFLCLKKKNVPYIFKKKEKQGR